MAHPWVRRWKEGKVHMNSHYPIRRPLFVNIACKHATVCKHVSVTVSNVSTGTSLATSQTDIKQRRNPRSTSWHYSVSFWKSSLWTEISKRSIFTGDESPKQNTRLRVDEASVSTCSEESLCPCIFYSNPPVFRYEFLVFTCVLVECLCLLSKLFVSQRVCVLWSNE